MRYLNTFLIIIFLYACSGSNLSTSDSSKNGELNIEDATNKAYADFLEKLSTDQNDSSAPAEQEIEPVSSLKSENKSKDNKLSCTYEISLGGPNSGAYLDSTCIQNDSCINPPFIGVRMPSQLCSEKDFYGWTDEPGNCVTGYSMLNNNIPNGFSLPPNNTGKKQGVFWARKGFICEKRFNLNIWYGEILRQKYCDVANIAFVNHMGKPYSASYCNNCSSLTNPYEKVVKLLFTKLINNKECRYYLGTEDLISENNGNGIEQSDCKSVCDKLESQCGSSYMRPDCIERCNQRHASKPKLLSCCMNVRFDRNKCESEGLEEVGTEDCDDFDECEAFD